MGTEITVVREGTGPEVLLVHGGASPATTWAGLEVLSRRWTLAYVHRRGFPPSPEPTVRQDFEIDATDLVALLEDRPHVVAHSYGAVGALIAAERCPGQLRSLTLIEPPIYFPASHDPGVARFQRMGDLVLEQGLDTDDATLREFLRIAGAPVRDGEPLPEQVINGVRRAHGSRPPSEARPRLDVLRDAGAERVVAPGAGHFVAAAPGFAARLEQFLEAAGSST